MRKTQKNLKYFALFALLLGQLSTQAQGLFSPRNVVNQYTTIGIGGGSSHYFGDLAPYRYFYHSMYTNVRWNGTINYTRYFTSQAAARVQFTWARISGDDYTFAQRETENLWRNYVRNLHFRNDIKEFTITGIFNILPQYSKGPRGRNQFMPYVMVGAGFYAHNPEATLPTTIANGAKEWIPLRDLKTAGQGLPGNPEKPYSLVQAVVPVGLGLRYKINEKFDFTIEGGLRLTPFDYLDDVSGDPFADPAELLRNYGDVSAAMGQRSAEVVPSRIPNENRLPQLIQYASDQEKVNGVVTFPVDPALFNQVVGFAASDVAGSTRGSKRIDSYFLTQFTISYIISNKVKCPVIK